MSEEILDEGFNIDENKIEFDKKTITQINLTKIDVNENIKHVKNARITLFVLSILALLSIIISYFYNPYDVSIIEVMIESLLFASIYAACAVGVKFNSRTALIIGLSVYILIQLLYIFVDVKTLFSGLLIKMIIIYFLVKGISASFKLKKDLEKLFRLGVPLHEIEMVKRLEKVEKTPR